jgi:predicted MFS family arabinose efflux permease
MDRALPTSSDEPRIAAPTEPAASSQHEWRWRILALLFLARCVMGIQFGSVGALGPLLRNEGIDYGQIGILIGAYLAPGVLVALPGGMLARRAGEKTVTLLCLTIMAAGSLLELDPVWTARLSGRLLAGTGGIVLTVAATRMIVDLFPGRMLAPALALFVNSWPCGIAIALMGLPPVAQTFGLASTSTLVAVLALAAMAATAVIMPRSAAPTGTLAAATPKIRAVLALCATGAIWGIANAASATIFGFGPALLAERSYAAQAAASQVSLVLWITIVTTPFGGLLARRRAGTDLLVVVLLAVAAGLMLAFPRSDGYAVLLAAMGVVTGVLGAGIMSLPSRVLNPQTSAIGMGIFYSVSYGLMLALPAVQGILARRTTSAAVTFDVAAFSLLAAILLFALFTILARGPKTAPAPA